MVHFTAVFSKWRFVIKSFFYDTLFYHAWLVP